MPVLGAPVPRQVKVAGPDISPASSGGILFGDVVLRIMTIGHRPTVCDHPAAQVFASLETNSDHATITVDITRPAAHRGTSDPIGQSKARLLPATPAFARNADAELTAFGCVDPEQSNTLAVDFDGVAVDDGADPDDTILRDCIHGTDRTTNRPMASRCEIMGPDIHA